MAVVRDLHQDLEISLLVAASLVGAGLIFSCARCGAFHLHMGYLMDDLDEYLETATQSETTH